jgi:hypothetical protein
VLFFAVFLPLAAEAVPAELKSSLKNMPLWLVVDLDPFTGVWITGAHSCPVNSYFSVIIWSLPSGNGIVSTFQGEMLFRVQAFPLEYRGVLIGLCHRGAGMINQFNVIVRN